MDVRREQLFSLPVFGAKPTCAGWLDFSAAGTGECEVDWTCVYKKAVLTVWFCGQDKHCHTIYIYYA